MEKILELNLEKLELTESGVSDYFWPIAMDEVKNIRVVIEEALSDLVKEKNAFDRRSSALFEVTLLSILNLMMQMVQATMLYVKCQDAGMKLGLTTNYHLLNMLQSNQMQGEHEFIRLLKKGPGLLKKIRLPLRIARDIVKGVAEEIPRRRLFGINFEKDVVTLSSHQLVREWKKECNDKVTFLRTNFWFKPVSQLTVQLNHDDNELIRRILSILEDSFSSFQLKIPNIIRSYFETFIQDAFLYSKHHLEQARLQGKIPMKLWGNTGGSVWMRLLSVLVREKGGEVTGFDHARGSSFSEDLSDYRFRELLVCNRFVTFSQKQAEEIAGDCQDNASFYDDIPTLSSIRSSDFRKPQSNKKVVIENKPKTIMYVSTIYPIERVGTNSHFMSDVMLLDWQVRLISQLKNTDYRILFKPHPECPIQPPKMIQDLFGDIVQKGSFESLMDKADLFIFDSLASTTFNTTIVSGMPLVFIDFGLRRTKADAEKLLSNRCSIVKGHFSPDNKAMVDWEELKKKIEEASLKQDLSFQKEYFYI